jgi:hypothetical protein
VTCPYCGKEGHGTAYHVPASAGTPHGSGRISGLKSTPPPNFGAKAPLSSFGGKCPKCGSTNFKTRRSTGRKVALGLVGSLLLKANGVECVNCGQRFKRA